MPLTESAHPGASRDGCSRSDDRTRSEPAASLPGQRYCPLHAALSTSNTRRLWGDYLHPDKHGNQSESWIWSVVRQRAPPRLALGQDGAPARVLRIAPEPAPARQEATACTHQTTAEGRATAQPGLELRLHIRCAVVRQALQAPSTSSTRSIARACTLRSTRACLRQG